jgi:3-oxoacyl-[acyl-carrier-protein] synthase-3
MAMTSPEHESAVLVATTTKDHITPDAAPLVAAELGAHRAGAFDVGAACTGFVTGVAVARGQIETGAAERVLVIGADALFQYLDPDDKRTAGLFGDGAGAVVMTATDPPGRVSTPLLRADGGQADLIFAHRGAKLEMQGRETFEHAVARLSEVTLEALAGAGIEADDIDLFVYHQANRRILRAGGERLGLPSERVLDLRGHDSDRSRRGPGRRRPHLGSASAPGGVRSRLHLGRSHRHWGLDDGAERSAEVEERGA